MSDIDTLLRQADPAAETPAYSSTERQEILARATADTHRPGRRIWRMASVAAATTLVAGLAFTNLGSGGATAVATEVLTQAAIRTQDEPMRADQYLKITTTGETMVFFSNGPADYCVVTFAYTDHVAVDGSRPSWFDRPPYQLADPSDSERCEVRESGDRWTHDYAPNSAPASWQEPTPAFLESLPRDVDALRERLYDDTEGRGVAHGRHASVHTYVQDVLRSGLVPADLRAALYEVLISVPGTDVVSDHVVDGRDVVAIGVTGEQGLSDYLLIDPETGAVVGEISDYGEALITTVTTEVVDEVPADFRAGAKVCDAEGACR